MNHKKKVEDLKLAIIGLGYVGLPLAIEFGKKREVIAFDINQTRISELSKNIDSTKEVSLSEFKESTKISFTSDIREISNCNCYIVTVPTPIDATKEPDLVPLLNACEGLSSIIKKGDIVIFESTVYPGCIEEDCVPVLEKNNSLVFNKDFYCGYSPERINPGDKDRKLKDITKITAGSTKQVAKLIDNLYKEIIDAGTFPVESIKIAEAAKVIENTQRDLNIALVNEFAKIFNNLDIDTKSVLDAAGTKWNFLNFRPGLVGGHCIGVDPYYLTSKSTKEGYRPELVLAGRNLNDGMPDYVFQKILEGMNKKNINVDSSKILIMGLTFKENCPDIRNSKVFNLIECLSNANANVDVYDPWVNKKEIDEEGFNLISQPENKTYDAIILAVTHEIFLDIGITSIKNFGKDNSYIYDLKYLFDHSFIDDRL